MNTLASSAPRWTAPAPITEPPAAAIVFTHPRSVGASSIYAALAGFLTAFTVQVVGEMPIGEILLLGAAGWAGACALFHQAWPGELFRRRYLAWLIGCQLIAFLAYAVADLHWHSYPRDIARGWSRMLFVVTDIFGIAYLLGRRRANFLFLLGGLLLGELANTLLFGALFGDTWKFGYGIPLSYATVLTGALLGPIGALIAAAGMGTVHFLMDFRSVGALCLILAVAMMLQAMPRYWRTWALPVGAAGALALVAVFYQSIYREGEEHRASRSDVDRSAMLQAAWEAFRESPLIGHGSWFSRSNVYDNFVQIRADAAQEAGVGGFVGPNEEPEAVALHSQLLVALAEGGLFGGAFFFAYGAGLIWALHDQVIVQTWRREKPTRVLLLLFALWNLFMSPFSGAHRVYIALAVCLILLIQTEHAAEETEGRAS